MNAAVVILSMLFFTSSIMCIALSLAWLHFGRQRHAATWAFAYGGGALQWLINALALLVFPGSPAPIIVASSIVIVTSTLVVIGARQRSRLPDASGWFMLAGSIAIAAIILTHVPVPHQGLRAALPNLYAAIMMPLGAAAVIPRTRRANVPEIAFATMLVLFGVYQLVIGLVALSAGAGPDPVALDRYRMALGIGLPTAYVGTGVAALFLLAGDLSESIRALVTRDPLTGSLNRRGLEQAATIAIADARRHGRPLSIVVGDIDWFKRINDRLGHLAGDRALVAFADHVQSAVREEDLFGRLGGDEFCLVMIDAAPGVAAEVVERIRHELAMLEIDPPSGIAMTASFGIAAFRPHDLSFAAILGRADDALYQSKEAGRNRVTIAGDVPIPPPDMPRISGTAAR